MTKAITTTAAMQLVEQGKVKLHDPAGEYLPELNDLQVIAGFGAAGKAQLRPAKRPVTLAHLITHTSGFSYNTWSPEMDQYVKQAAPAQKARWYLIRVHAGSMATAHNGRDGLWKRSAASRLNSTCRTISGAARHGRYQLHSSTGQTAPAGFHLSPSTDGKLTENPRNQPATPREFNGDGGLFCTAPITPSSAR